MTNASKCIDLFSAMILLAAIGRVGSVAQLQHPMVGPAPELVRQICLANDFQPDSILASPMAGEIGLQSAERWVLDPSATVLLCGGLDARPGKADVDDDADGVVDNASELGAMYSDDVCLAPTDHGYTYALQSEACKVISRGAYVAENAKKTRKEQPHRIKLIGQQGGKRWERLVLQGDGKVNIPDGSL